MEPIFETIDFGDYVKIEQKRFGHPNEMYLYKVIQSFKSNGWVDIPVSFNSAQTNHADIVPVLGCVCCGVIENKVVTFRAEDVNLVPGPPRLKKGWDVKRNYICIMGNPYCECRNGQRCETLPPDEL